ncbi:MAG: FAD-dependent oxidoreductase [Thermoplasmatales archaeon]
MITTIAEISVEREISDHLFLLSVKLERYKQWVPGMFLQISLSKKNASEPWLDGRAFSFASWGSENASILVRKEGNFTAELIAKAKTEFVTSVRYPFGSFFLNSAGNKILIAGGAGVSVFLGYLDYLNAKDNRHSNVLLFHSTKSGRESLKNIYAGKIADNVMIDQFVTDRNDPNYTGRLSTEVLMKSIKDVKAFEYYVCGPPKFNSYWLEELKRLGAMPKVEQWEN